MRGSFYYAEVGTFKQGVSKQGVMTFAWRPGSQYDVAATRGADSVLASDCRGLFGLPSTRKGCRICVTVRLPVRPRGETMYWQANANTALSVTPLFNVPYRVNLLRRRIFLGRRDPLGWTFPKRPLFQNPSPCAPAEARR